ncbi:hypothetical protein U1Q18_015390 [Sarracenia purpurea var. burkii]
MALEAVVFQEDHIGYNPKDLYSLIGVDWGSELTGFLAEEREDEYGFFDTLENQTENLHLANWNSHPHPHPHPHPPPAPSVMVPCLEEWRGGLNSSSTHEEVTFNLEEFLPMDTSTAFSIRPKRRRSKGKKNMEEIENQRMTHITVERNRRKQMNEYLSVLRQLMPDYYIQKGDQASIIGGAINYVKELEQKLHFLGGHKHMMNQKFEAGSSSCSSSSSPSSSSPFPEFFTIPQYSTSSACSENSTMVATDPSCVENQSAAIADIEVTMVESHANLKIRSKTRPKQLLNMVSGFQILRLTILHLNVITADQTVLYSVSVKVEDDCKLNSVEEIATAVNQMLGYLLQFFAMFCT